jgi:hypothetical protein
VFIKPRKHLSSHPKASTWDPAAISELTRKLTASGEVLFYNKAQVTHNFEKFGWGVAASLTIIIIFCRKR